MVKRLFAGLIMAISVGGAYASASAPADSSSTYHRAVPVVTRIGGSAVLNLAFTEILKSSIHEVRPDGSNHNSWPSRHTSWAFTAASVVTHELYAKSAWWAVGSQTAANAVAIQRLLSNNHFPKDVLGGAAVGLVSTELGYFLTDLIFPGSGPRLQDATDEWLPGFDALTSAIFPIGNIADGYSARTGYGAALRFTLPCHDLWGLTASVSMSSLPIYLHGRFCSMLNSVGFSLGGAAHWTLSDRFGAEARLMPGVARNFDGDGVPHPGWSFTLDIVGSATFAITRSFTAGIELNYNLHTFDNALNSLGLSMLTRVRF